MPSTISPTNNTFTCILNVNNHYTISCSICISKELRVESFDNTSLSNLEYTCAYSLYLHLYHVTYESILKKQLEHYNLDIATTLSITATRLLPLIMWELHNTLITTTCTKEYGSAIKYIGNNMIFTIHQDSEQVLAISPINLDYIRLESAPMEVSNQGEKTKSINSYCKWLLQRNIAHISDITKCWLEISTVNVANMIVSSSTVIELQKVEEVYHNQWKTIRQHLLCVFDWISLMIINPDNSTDKLTFDQLAQTCRISQLDEDELYQIISPVIIHITNKLVTIAFDVLTKFMTPILSMNNPLCIAICGYVLLKQCENVLGVDETILSTLQNDCVEILRDICNITYNIATTCERYKSSEQNIVLQRRILSILSTQKDVILIANIGDNPLLSNLPQLKSTLTKQPHMKNLRYTSLSKMNFIERRKLQTLKDTLSRYHIEQTTISALFDTLTIEQP